MKKVKIYIIFFFKLLIGINGISAQPPTFFNVYCSMDGRTELSILRNEPVLIDIKIFNSKAQYDQRWNWAVERRIQTIRALLNEQKIQQEEFDHQNQIIEKDKRITEVIILGDSVHSWTSGIKWHSRELSTNRAFNLPLKLLSNSVNQGIALLDANHLYTANLGIDPEQMKSLPPGTYEINVFVDDISSNTIVLKILPGKMSTALSQSEKFLLQMGRYYWNDNDSGKTLFFAGKAVAKYPRSIKALILLGDGQVLGKSFAQALETYNKAITTYYSLNGQDSDPPEYLLAMIHHIKKELGQYSK